MAYKNIIFDLGGVMLDWNPEKFLSQAFPENTPKHFVSVFRSILWYAHDGGLFSRQEVIERLPEEIDRKQFADFVFSLHRRLTPIEEMVQLFSQLKAQGHKVYILSNMPGEMYQELRALHDFFKHADGQVISFEAKAVKPMPEIYRILLSRYDLCPKECLFIDDLEDNIEAAKRCGIQGIVFRSPAQVRQELSAWLAT